MEHLIVGASISVSPMEGEVESASEDTRLSWLGLRVVSALKVKPDAFGKFASSENRCATRCCTGYELLSLEALKLELHEYNPRFAVRRAE